MIVKVLKSFIDKYTDHHYSIGEVFEADEARIEEIKRVDSTLIEVVPDTVPDTEQEQSTETVVEEKPKRKKRVKEDNDEV